MEADRINLYEREAEKGDDRKFLEETDRVFKENLRGDPAWKLYERKLVYLESKQPDISREFERFLKKYPKVMDAYVDIFVSVLTFFLLLSIHSLTVLLYLLYKNEDKNMPTRNHAHRSDNPVRSS